MGVLPDYRRCWTRLRITDGEFQLYHYTSPSWLPTNTNSQPIVAVQNHLKPELVSVGLAAVVFSQGFGPALFLSFAQTIFSNSLKDKLHHFAPEVDAQTVFAAGATGIRTVISAASLPGVIMSYNESVNNVFYLITGAAVAAFISCWGMGWKSVKKPKVEATEV
jgi:hypothetical protein